MNSTIEKIETQLSDMRKFIGIDRPTRAQRTKDWIKSIHPVDLAKSGVARVRRIRVKNVNPFYMK